MALGKFGQHPLGMVDLRQDPLRERQQIFARLRQPQPAAFLLPDADLVALLEFADGVGQRRLGQVQPVGGGGDLSGAVDLAQDGDMLAVKH